jgi:hypothetical protein
MNPGTVSVSPGKKPWKTAPQKAALASPAMSTAGTSSSEPRLAGSASLEANHAPRNASPRSVRTTSGS